MLVGVAPSLPHSHPLEHIGILLHKQATQTKHFCPKCICKKKITWMFPPLVIFPWYQLYANNGGRILL